MIRPGQVLETPINSSDLIGEEMVGVREYGEEMPVFLRYYVRDPKYDAYQKYKIDAPRLTVIAFNEGGYCSTEIDVLDLVDWLKTNKPEVFSQ